MSESVQFQDKVVIVTGAGGGLGRAHALLFAKHGAKVLVNDLGGSTQGEGANASAADRVVAEIRAAGGLAEANHDSVTDGDKIVQNALDAFGRIDVVIFTASTSGIYGNFGQSNYGMAKLGLYGLTRTLALEGRKNNILVNAIAPTGGTRMTEGLIPPQVFERLKPELVSPLVVYLGSDACQETSGLFEVGGGWIGKTRWERSLGVGFDPEAGFSPDDVAAHWQQICDFEGAAHPKDNIEALKEMMANLQKFSL